MSVEALLDVSIQLVRRDAELAKLLQDIGFELPRLDGLNSGTSHVISLQQSTFLAVSVCCCRILQISAARRTHPQLSE